MNLQKLDKFSFVNIIANVINFHIENIIYLNQVL